MRTVIVLFLIFILAASCKKEEKTYYPNGSLKTVAEIANSKYHGSFKSFYEDGELEFKGSYNQGLMQGLFTYYHKPEHQFSKSEILFRNDTAYYRKNYNKSGKLIAEGSLKENSKIGKWKYYDFEEDYVKNIREVFYVNGKSHLNQNWELNKQGDTIGGYYYKIKANDPMDFHNQVIRFIVDKVPYYKHSEIYVYIPKKDGKQFNEYFSNENEVVFDTISNPLLWKGDNDIVVNLKYEAPGKKLLRGFLLEKKSFADVDTVDYDHVTRKVYFEKEIYIKDRTDNDALP